MSMLNSSHVQQHPNLSQSTLNIIYILVYMYIHNYTCTLSLYMYILHLIQTRCNVTPNPGHTCIQVSTRNLGSQLRTYMYMYTYHFSPLCIRFCDRFCFNLLRCIINVHRPFVLLFYFCFCLLLFLVKYKWNVLFHNVYCICIHNPQKTHSNKFVYNNK